jgi:hypothetical protein
MAADVESPIRARTAVGTAAARGLERAEPESVPSAAVAAWSADRREAGQMAGFVPRAGGPRPSGGPSPELRWLAPQLASELGRAEAARVAEGVAQADAAVGGEARRLARGAGPNPAGAPAGATSAAADTAVWLDGRRADASPAEGREAATRQRAGRAAANAFDAEPADGLAAPGASGTRAPRGMVAPEGVLPRIDGVAGDAGARATFEPRTGAGLLARALARAWRPEDVAAAVGEHAAEVEQLAAVLPEPAARALREVAAMRTLPEDAAQLLSTGKAAEAETPKRGAVESGSSWSPARRVRGGGRTASASAESTDGSGASRLMKLSQRLMSLIHLAEVENRAAEAQRQVRRSDEKVDAAQTGGAGKADGLDGVTMASLQREVLEMVQRELETMRERGEGGRHGDFWW